MKQSVSIEIVEKELGEAEDFSLEYHSRALMMIKATAGCKQPQRESGTPEDRVMHTYISLALTNFLLLLVKYTPDNTKLIFRLFSQILTQNHSLTHQQSPMHGYQLLCPCRCLTGLVLICVDFCNHGDALTQTSMSAKGGHYANYTYIKNIQQLVALHNDQLVYCLF